MKKRTKKEQKKNKKKKEQKTNDKKKKPLTIESNERTDAGRRALERDTRRTNKPRRQDKRGKIQTKRQAN